MRRGICFLFLSLLLPHLVMAASLDSLRLGKTSVGSRLVLDLSTPVEHKIFTLPSPPRLVIDLQDTTRRGALPAIKAKDPLIKSVRSGTRKGGALRVVVDLRAPVVPKSFFLKSDRQNDHPRLVVDLRDRRAVTSAKLPEIKKDSAEIKHADVVIAIDAGHGGNDPGANGHRGTDEKDVVLAMARKLKKLIDREPGMKGFLVRDGDYYLGLRERMDRARAAKADLFISIHADAFHDSSVQGASVYTLSDRGASSEAAKWLADKENAVDLGGVSLEGKDELLASVLLDLSQSATTEASTDIADRVLSSLKGIGRTHKPTVQQAGFVVLKSPDIPSILVETAFISNPNEEKRLRSDRHQQKVAKAIFSGVRRYFMDHPPPGSRLALRTHVIKSGDTLSEIAEKYHITVAELRDINGLKSNRIRTGQKIRVPGS